MRIIFLVSFLHTVHSSTVCHKCQGVSKTSGSICSNDNVTLCSSQCGFQVTSSGTWTGGCADTSTHKTTDSALKCFYDSSTKTSECVCNGDFCNTMHSMVEGLLATWTAAGVTNTIALPSAMATECFQCGSIDVPGRGAVNVTCDPSNTCNGDYCLTKRGENPHSYCGTAWEGSPDVKCTKNPGQPELCVCAESLCNAIYDPIIEETDPTKTTAAPTPGPTPGPTAGPTAGPTPGPTTGAAGTTTTKAGGITCKDGRFIPNALAVQMGEKLKDKILGLFSKVNLSSTFAAGMDDHICNYSPTS